MAEPTLAEVIRRAIDSRALDLHVALPGRVEKYDAATQTAEVLPMVRRAIVDEDGDVQHEDLPPIPNVQIAFPRGGGFSATWPLDKGDHVLLVFNSWATGQWRETGDISDPIDLRKHSLSNPVAIPGVAPKREVLPTDAAAAVIEVAGTATELKVGAAASSFVSLDDKVQTRLGEIYTAISGAAVAAGDGGATLKSAIIAALGASGWAGGGTTPTTASTKLKAE